MFALRVISLNSNSFIEAEDKVLQFFLASSSFLLLLFSSHSFSSSNFSFSLLLLLFIPRFFTSSTGGRYDSSDPIPLAEVLLPIFVLTFLLFSSFNLDTLKDLSTKFSEVTVTPIVGRLFGVSFFAGISFCFRLSNWSFLNALSVFFDILLSTCFLPLLLSFSYETNPSSISKNSLPRWELLMVWLQSALMGGYWSAVHFELTGDLHSTSLIAFFFRILLPDLVYAISVVGGIYRTSEFIFSSAKERSSISVFLYSLSIWMYPFLALILGKRSLFGFFLSYLLLSLFHFSWSSSSLSSKSVPFSTPPFSSVGLVVLFVFLAQFFFYKTGHKPDFSALHFQSPYVGFDHYSFLAGAVFLISNTFVAQIFVTIIFFAVISKSSSSPSESNSRSSSSRGERNPSSTEASVDVVRFASAVFSNVLQFVSFYGLCTAMTMIFTGIQRRHLMVWRIFAPKYIFDASSNLALNGVVLLLWILVALRIARATEV